MMGLVRTMHGGRGSLASRVDLGNVRAAQSEASYWRRGNATPPTPTRTLLPSLHLSDILGQLALLEKKKV